MEPLCSERILQSGYLFVLKWFKNCFEMERDNDYFAA